MAQLIRAVDHGMDVLHAAYERLIHWVFERPRRNRAIVLALGGASFLGALALAPVVGSEFVPQTDQGFTQLALRLPVGASLDRTDAKVRQIEEIVRAMPEVENLSTWVGGAGQRNQAWLNIALKDRKLRDRSQKQVEDFIREQIAKIPGTDASLGFDRPVYIAILGTDPEGLAKAVAEAKPFLAFRVSRVLDAANVSTPEGRARAAAAAIEVVREHPSTFMRDQYVMEIADVCRVDPQQLREQLARAPRPKPQADDRQQQRRRRDVDDDPGPGFAGGGGDDDAPPIGDEHASYQYDDDDLGGPPVPRRSEPIGDSSEVEALRLMIHRRAEIEGWLQIGRAHV